jgi:uncharacterized protein YndB with AHSA1/START domain
MNEEVKITKFIPLDNESLFNYFMTAELLEQWAYPDGMSLTIPQFEAKEGGHYIYEHTAENGVYICTGYIKELIPHEKLVQHDSSIKGPNGKILFENLENTIVLEPKFGGTEVTISQKGFMTPEGVKECEEGWTQSLDHLSRLVDRRISSESFRESRI